MICIFSFVHILAREREVIFANSEKHQLSKKYNTDKGLAKESRGPYKGGDDGRNEKS